jgi:hypothetical protein
MTSNLASPSCPRIAQRGSTPLQRQKRSVSEDTRAMEDSVAFGHIVVHRSPCTAGSQEGHHASDAFSSQDRLTRRPGSWFQDLPVRIGHTRRGRRSSMLRGHLS